MECKNCLYVQPDDFDYCPECGAKVIRNRLTFKNLWNDAVRRYFDIDNTVLKSFVHLITQPEVVIDGYIHGVRKKYINPISYFAFALTLAGLQVFLIQKLFPNAYDYSSLAAEGQEEFMRDSMDFIKEYTSVINMLFIPVYALMARIVFLRNKKYNYTELLVVFLYYAAEITFITIVPILIAIGLGANYGELSPYVMVFQILFGAYYIKRLYALNWKGLILKTLLFFVVLLVFYVIAVAIATVMLIWQGIIPVEP